jgi:ABC-2 type transport system permease protein
VTNDLRSWSRQLIVLVERQLRLRTKRSVLGNVWPIGAPFVLTVLYTFVFNHVFDASIRDYTVFLLCGLIPWTFLTQCLGKTINAVTFEADLVRSMPIKTELLPLSNAMSQALNFVATVGLFVVYLAMKGQLHVAILPVLLLPIFALVLLTSSLSLIVALIDVYSRDLRLVMGNLLLIWFFLVPIVYRQAMAPHSLAWLQSVDPMNLIVGQFRSILYIGNVGQPGHMVLMLVVCGGLFVGCLAFYRRFSRHVAEDI